VEWAGGSAIAFTVAHMLLCVSLRPNSVRAELWASVLLDAMSVVSVALSMCAHDAAADGVASAAAIVQVLVTVSLMVNGLHVRWERMWLVTALEPPTPTPRINVVAADDISGANLLSKPKVAVTTASTNNYKASTSNLRLVERSVATRDGQSSRTHLQSSWKRSKREILTVATIPQKCALATGRAQAFFILCKVLYYSSTL
jgi:hypothetical protein